MREEIRAVSGLLKGKTRVICRDFTAAVDRLDPATGLVYLDPPYQGTSGGRDPGYCSDVERPVLSAFLAELKARNAMSTLGYDG